VSARNTQGSLRELSIYDLRFFQPFENIGLRFSLAAVFRGQELLDKLSGMKWFDGCVHKQERPKNPETPPSIKFYFIDDDEERAEEDFKLLNFSSSLQFLSSTTSSLGIPFQKFDWTAQILPLTRAFCARVSELEEARIRRQSPPIFGFGRPHLFSDKFEQKNPTLMGPIADFHPMSELPKDLLENLGHKPWIFEPVWVGVVSSSGGLIPQSRLIRIQSLWGVREVKLECVSFAVTDHEVPEIVREVFNETYYPAR